MCSQYVVHGDILNHVREVQGLYYISIERPSVGTLINQTGQKESDLAKPDVWGVVNCVSCGPPQSQDNVVAWTV